MAGHNDRRYYTEPKPLPSPNKQRYTEQKLFLNSKKLIGLNPFVDIPRKVYWRTEITPFTKAFVDYAFMKEDNKDVDIYSDLELCEKVFMKKIDKMIDTNKIDSAHWWLYELYKRTQILSPIRSTPLAMKLAEIEKGNPFEKLDRGLAKIMLTFAYGSVDMQLRFTSHLERRLAENKKEIGNTEMADEKLMNKYKEIKKELDDWANNVLCKTMLRTGEIKRIYSEELDHPIDPKDSKFRYRYKSGRYIITLDPLDGSGNIKTRNIFGSILGVYEDNEPKSGRELKAAAIILYGPVFSFIYSTGDGVHELVKNYGNRGFSQFEQMADGQNIKIPQKPSLVIPGGNTSWSPEFSEFVVKEFLPNYKIRCSGAAVMEIASLLREGGIFFYPAPKLRLLYEGIPLSFLVEQAGGKSYDGKLGSLLDTPIANMDQVTSLYVGNEGLIEKVKLYYSSA